MMNQRMIFRVFCSLIMIVLLEMRNSMYLIVLLAYSQIYHSSLEGVVFVDNNESTSLGGSHFK